MMVCATGLLGGLSWTVSLGRIHFLHGPGNASMVTIRTSADLARADAS